MWEENREGSNDESMHSKPKIEETQISIIKEKHSRYLPPANHVWEEKEEVSYDDSSYSNYKTKETQVSIRKKNIQGTHHPLIVFAWKRKREVMMKAAIQNTK